MIIRKRYFEQIIPLIDKPIIKVITGVRRSGKTILLNQIKDHLLEKGVDSENVLYYSFESKATKKQFGTSDALYDSIINTCKDKPKRYYVFLDEIQLVDKWEEVVCSLLVDINVDIYLTGSNAKMLSGELATLIAGRYIQIKIYPFTFKEAKELCIQNGRFISNEKLFLSYLKYGGLPMRFSLEDTSTESYLRDVFETIVIKDVISRNDVRNSGLLYTILNFLMDNVSNPYSTRQIVEGLKNSGVQTTVQTVSTYIGYITEAMILYSAKRYDVKGKRLLQSIDKYYAVDTGLRNIAKTSDNLDYSKLYENIVFIELLSRGYNVAVGKEGDKEIDFIAYKGQEKLYVQVCYMLSSDNTINREFGNLESIKDNHPKYVVSSDILDFSRNGIKHFNIIDFLLSDNL